MHLENIMKHPELVRLASVRGRMSVERLVMQALRTQRFYNEGLTKIMQRYEYLNEMPQFVEDYALQLLARYEREQKEQCLLNGYEQWRIRP